MAAMDLTTYAGLQAAIASFLNRTDLADFIPGFITLAEASIKTRIRRKTIRDTLQITGETSDLPVDAVELRSIRLVTGEPWRDSPMTVGTFEQLADLRTQLPANGRPRAAAIYDGKLVVVPTPDTDYTADVVYFEKLVPLSAENDSNSVFEERPDLYLYGALVHSAPFLEHDERLEMWQGMFDRGIAELDAARASEELGASIRKARLPVVIG